MKNVIERFLADRSGATAIEYGLIGAGIFLAIITALTQVGTNLSSTFMVIKSNI